jgi:hypothetical protein
MRFESRRNLSGAALLLILLTPSLCLLVPSLAGAQIIEGTAEIEFYGGAYVFSPDALPTEPVIGFRGGLNLSEFVNAQVDFCYLRAKTTVAGEGDVSAELDHKVSLVGLTIAAHPRLHRRWVGAVFGGPGWAFVDSKVTVEGDVPEDAFVPDRLKEDSFFLDFGVAARGYMSRSWYLRPDARMRWIQRRDADSIDFMVSFAVGFVLGP